MPDEQCIKVLKYLRKRSRDWKNPPPTKTEFKKLLLLEIIKEFRTEEAYDCADLALTMWVEGGEFMDENSGPQKKMTPFFIIVFLGMLVVFCIVLSQLSNLSSFSSSLGSYAVISFVSLVCSVGLFGVLHSTGTFTGQKWGLAVQLGGAAAFFVVMVGVGIYFELKTRQSEIAFSAYVCDFADHEKILDVDGTLTLYLEERKEVAISHGGAYPQHLAASWNDQKVGYMIHVPGYDLPPNHEEIKIHAGSRILIPVIQITTTASPATAR